MNNNIQKFNFLLFLVIPLVIFLISSYPQRSILKDTFSLLTLAGIFLIYGQFSFKNFKIHKIIGYTTISILLFHPFFIVIPRFFEAGISPKDAFITILSTYESLGIIFGVIAWFLMLFLYLTSLFKNKLSMKHKNWSLLHGLVSLFIVMFATFHALDLGRHMNVIFILTLVSFAFISSIYWVKKRLI